MSDPYNIGAVTLTAKGGGYYDLAYGEELEKVQGKENAEARAAEINAALVPAEGSMEQQPNLNDLAPPVVEQQGGPATVTVNVDGNIPDPRTVLRQVPSQFVGEMDEGVKEALASIGIKTTKIVLEEHESIPPTGLFVSHNGRAYVIVPGEPVDVPDHILEVLDHAIMSTPIVDQKSQQVINYRDRSKYPYRRV